MSAGEITIGQVGEMESQAASMKKIKIPRIKRLKNVVLTVDLLPSGEVKVYEGKKTIGGVVFARALSGGVGLMATKAKSLADNFSVWRTTVQ